MELTDNYIKEEIGELWEGPGPLTPADVQHILFIVRTFMESNTPDPIQNAVIAFTEECNLNG